MYTLFLLSATLAAGIINDRILRKHLQAYPRFPAALLLSITAYIFLLMAFHNPLMIAKGLLLAELMIAISFYDGLTHHIPNQLLLPVLAAGFLDFHFIPAFIGFFIVSLPFLLISALTKGGYGGGDIKLMAATGFSLGHIVVFGGAIIGLMAFIPFSTICRHHHHKQTFNALAPWLCSGCFFAYLLINSGGYK